MKTIWKFPLDLADRQIVSMPAGATLLTVQMQGHTPCLWALVDTEVELNQIRTIEIHGTGNPIDEARRKYIATFQQPPFVWHVFERD